MEYIGITIKAQDIDPILSIVVTERQVTVYNGYHEYVFSHDEFMQATYYKGRIE